ncbi:hypothetical protein ABIF69_006368 [Bradyrhizobium japonicum]
MVNIKVPINPVQKRGLWPPKGGREYPVLDTDDWWKIAAREHIDAWALIEFNFQTHVPEEVNWCHSACNIDPLSRGIGVQN